MKSSRLPSPLALLTLLSAAACSAGADDAEPPRVSRTMLGDTTVVRTESGSAWGEPARLVPEVSIGEMDGALEYLFGSVRSLGVADDGTIYVLDAQGPDLRVYGPDGRYVKTIGTPGEGPGELKQPDGGLAVLSDGRIVVRDPGNARLQVYAPDGRPLAAWPARGGFNTGAPLYRDGQDNVYTQILVDPTAEVKDWVIGLVRIDDTGQPGDTLVPPDAGHEPSTIEARSPDGGGVSLNTVPFTSVETTAFHPGGFWVHGITDEYRIRLLDPDAPTVVERVAPREPVSAGEKIEAEARVTRSMRQTQPGWRWNGPPIPDRKPAFNRFFAGADGRLWVAVPQPAVEVEDLDYDPTDPNSVPHRWREPVAFDVFERDGTYLGEVRAPMGFVTYPTPIFGGDRVWAVVRDELDVQRVVRFRIERGAAGL